MDFKGKLAPLALQARTNAIDNLMVAEATILRLPRPLSKLKDDAISRHLGSAMVRVLVSTVSLRTGKAALMFTVKNRQLNRYGRVSAIITLVTSAATVALTVHESWARIREPENLGSIERDLHKILEDVLSAHKPSGRDPIGFTD